MKVTKISDKDLQLEFSNREEQYYVGEHFKREGRNSKFQPYSKKTSFLRFNFTIPIGLWRSLKDFTTERNIECSFPQEEEIYRDIDKDTFVDWCKDEIKDTAFDEYDMKDTYLTAYEMVCNKFARFNLSVAYGKSVTFYLASKFLYEKGYQKQILILTSKPQLAQQLLGEFADLHKNESPFCYGLWRSGVKKRKAPIIISSFSYFVNLTEEFNCLFDSIFIDECHRASAYSYKKIYNNLTNIISSVGGTGSLQEDESEEDFQIMAITGHTVKTVTKREIIDVGRATDGVICFLNLNYIPLKDRIVMVDSRYDEKVSKLESLRSEREKILEYDWRLKVLSKFTVMNAKKRGNGVVFFKTVSSGYAQRFIDYCKETNDGIEYLYVDENVPVRLRQEYVKMIEKQNNIVLVGTYDTISTGISAHNLHWGLTLESFKSFTILEQLLGRFMRNHASKKKFTLYDVVDDGRVKVEDTNGGTRTVNNYMYSWYVERKKMYKVHQFKIVEQSLKQKVSDSESSGRKNKFKPLL